MNETEFEKTVREMRRWQKAYFRSRSPGDLRYAKDYERRIDAELERRCKQQQGSLI